MKWQSLRPLQLSVHGASVAIVAQAFVLRDFSASSRESPRGLAGQDGRAGSQARTMAAEDVAGGSSESSARVAGGTAAESSAPPNYLA